MDINVAYNEDCVIGMNRIENESVDVVCMDPPYLYLKNQKLDVAFDEKKLFEHIKRILKPSGFVVMFGRGASFYRWNTMLSYLGFRFKEEIIWDKRYCSSPLMNISRVHETISLWTKNNGKINKVKVPYVEMKKYDLPSIFQDIKRMKSILSNTKALDAVSNFIENNIKTGVTNLQGNGVSITGKITKENQAASVVRSIQDGMIEKTIIRSDFENCERFTKHNVTCDNTKSGDKACNAFQSVSVGMNEKSIIQEVGNRYKSIHPTEKPVRLLERLLAIAAKPGDLVVDPFAGSFSTAKACINYNLNYIVFEIDKEYFDLGLSSLNEYLRNHAKNGTQGALFK